MKSKLLILVLLAFTFVSEAQNLVLVDSIKLKDISQLSVDRMSNVYATDKAGNIYKFDANTFEQLQYSPVNKSEVGLLEATNPLKIFAFYPQQQQYIFLDRFLVSASIFDLNTISSFIGMATISLDNNLWLIDLADFSLKKYSVTFNQVEINRPFDLLLDPKNYEITHMHEYQNLLFISDAKSGILVFDNLGNYLKTIQTKGIQYFNFLGDELYYEESGQLVFINLYSERFRQEEIPATTKHIIATEKLRFFASADWLKIYKVAKM